MVKSEGARKEVKSSRGQKQQDESTRSTDRRKANRISKNQCSWALKS
jgi:hypothetical protein